MENIEKTKIVLLDDADSEVMDWFYECIDISFGVEMVQDSTQLRCILEDVIDRAYEAGFRHREEIENEKYHPSCQNL